MLMLYQNTTWKHCFIRQTWKLCSSVRERGHNSDRIRHNLNTNNGVSSFQRNVPGNRYLHIITMSERNKFTRMHFKVQHYFETACMYSTSSGTFMRKRCACSPLVSERLYSNNVDSINSTSRNEEDIKDRNKGTKKQMDDISKHPEVQDMLKEIMNDFEAEFKSVEDSEKEPGQEMQEDSAEPINKVTDVLQSETSSSDDSSSDSDSSDLSSSESSDSDEELNDNLQKALHVNEWDVIDGDKDTVDVDKEMSRYNIEEFYGIEYTEEIQEDENVPSREELLPISLNRGETGVFDVEDLVAVLKEDNLQDICVISIPKEVQFVDYMVLASGKAIRQLEASAENIQWIWKRKRGKKDPHAVQVEGRNSKNWLAIDLGNIALHLFLPEVREQYDLETLWTCGPEYDARNAPLQESYSIPISTGVSLEESRHALISKIDQQIRLKKQGQSQLNDEVIGYESGEGDVWGTTWSTDNDRSQGIEQRKNNEFVMSKDLFDNDTAAERVRRKYSVKGDVKASEDDVGFENTAGYHPKYDGSETK